MIKQKSISKNIIFLVSLLLLIQLSIFSAITQTHQTKLSLKTSFYIFTVLYHLVFIKILISSKKYFRLEPSMKPLSKINFPNMLTTYRISSLPTLCFLLITNSQENNISLVIFTLMSLTFITDFFDGFISRRFNQTTTIGKYLDSTSDYLLVFTIAITFLIYKIIPLWIFLLLFTRFFIHSLSLLVLYFKHGYIKFKTTPIGKLSVFITMCLLGLEIFISLFDKEHFLNKTFIYFEYFCAIILIISTIEKFHITLKSLFSKEKAHNTN